LIEYEVNINEGMVIVDTILKNYPDLWGWLRLKGMALHKLGRHKEAMEILREADGKIAGWNPWIEKEIQEVEKALASLTE